MKVSTDQLNRTIRIENPLSGIVSLVPSLTELLVDLGLENELKGITKFCIHPDHVFQSKIRIGGTKNIHHDIIDDIQPGLIIANKEENNLADINILEKKYPVWVTDVNTLDDAYSMIKEIGSITEKSEAANALCIQISKNFRSLNPLKKVRTLYLIWDKPYMAAGTDTFINEMMSCCGMENVLPSSTRYPKLSESEIEILNPELILLSTEPWPFKESDCIHFRSKFTNAITLLADGEYFSWYGSRLADAPVYFKKLIAEYSSTQLQNC